MNLGTYGSGSTAKTWYARHVVNNTPSTTTTSGETQTHDFAANTLPSPYTGKEGTIANVSIVTATSGSNGMTTTDSNVTLNNTAC